MYVTPKTLQRPDARPNHYDQALQNTAVQLIATGRLKDEISAQRAAPQWYATIAAVAGLVLKQE